jgi:hypothetical protein
MLSSVFLVDCGILICRFENGRGVFPFVVMGLVVVFGSLFSCYCVCVWYIVVVLFGDIWWFAFVVAICCHLFCLVGGGKWLACQMCPQISLFPQVASISIGPLSGISSCLTSLLSSPLTNGTNCLHIRV